MERVFGLDTSEVREESRRIVAGLGGELCDWLPWLDETSPRSADQVAARALVMNVMIQIHFGAPTEVVRSWIEANGLAADLSDHERHILEQPEEEISEQDSTNLFWYMEALWALAWSGSLIPEIPVQEGVGDHLARLLPDLRIRESSERFRQSFKLRSAAELYRMLDLYYLAHWHARHGQLRGVDPSPFSLDVIMERRKALEWALDSTIEDWDDTPQDT